MKGLLVKDFSILLQQKKTYAMILLLAIFLNYNSGTSDGTFAIGYLTFICTTLILNSIAYDEHENGYLFLFTLPIMRKTYVRSKYLFTVIVCTLSWVIGNLVSAACFIAKNQMGKMEGAMAGMEMILAVCLIFLAVMLPIQLKFGAEKGRIALGIVFGIFFLSGYLLIAAAKTDGFQKLLQQIISLYKQDIWLLEICIWIGTIAVMGVSYWASSTVMKKKEF